MSIPSHPIHPIPSHRFSYFFQGNPPFNIQPVDDLTTTSPGLGTVRSGRARSHHSPQPNRNKGPEAFLRNTSEVSRLAFHVPVLSAENLPVRTVARWVDKDHKTPTYLSWLFDFEGSICYFLHSNFSLSLQLRSILHLDLSL